MAGVSGMTAGRAACSWERQFSAQTALGRSCPPQWPASPALAVALLGQRAAPHSSSATVTIIGKCAWCAILLPLPDLRGKVTVLLWDAFEIKRYRGGNRNSTWQAGGKEPSEGLGHALGSACDVEVHLSCVQWARRMWMSKQEGLQHLRWA